MKPCAYYPQCYDRNAGRIKSISENAIVVSVNPGHGGGDMELPKNCVWTGKHNAWRQVEPRLNACVLLCVDLDAEGAIVLLQQQPFENRQNI